MFDIIFSLVKDFPHDISLGRMAESIVLLAIIWRKLKPHLDNFEAKLGALDKSLKESLTNDENRFQKVESRITALEKTKGETYDQSIRPSRLAPTI
jgi:hypothetical protein